MAMAHALRHSVGLDLKALTYALLLHGLVLAVLVANLYWPGNRGVPKQNIIEARVVLDKTAAPVTRVAPTKPKETAQDIARKKAEAVAQQKAIALKKKRAAENARRAAALKKKKQQQEAARRRQQQAQKELKQALAAEEQERTAQVNEAKAMAAMAELEGLIRQRVTRNWIRPVGVPQGLNCLVRVRLAPGGEVLAVSIVKSSGNALFDRSVENAVYKAAPLPVPDDPQLFKYVREINIKFDPQDQ
jgi:colicin import membrane protein